MESQARHARLGLGLASLHHQSRDSAFERNDLYAVTFAALVMRLFLAGLRWEQLWWAAIGIAIYGGIYAFVHDV